MSSNGFLNSFEIVKWPDVRDGLFHHNKELTEAIDQCKPTKEHQLLKVKYSYGEHIIRSGSFHFPNEHGMLVPFAGNTIDNGLKKMLDYYWGSIPLGVLLSGSAESFWSGYYDQTISLNILRAGSTFALRTIFDEGGWCNFKDAFNLTSGPRSLFILSSMKDATRFKKLIKALERRIQMPKNFDEHWNLLKDIYHSKLNQGNWHAELLFFTTPWVKDMFSGKFQPLHNYLREKIWVKTEFKRNRKIFDYIWSDFIVLFRRSKFKAKDYLFDFAKHLILIAIGDEYGFIPTVDESIAPIKLFRNVLIDYYKITQNPVLMCPTTVKWEEPSKIYFSLQRPTNLITYPHRVSNSSSLDDVRDVKIMMDFFIQSIQNSKLSLGNTRFVEIPEKIRFDYYHTDKDFTKQVVSSSFIAKEDDRFNSSEKLEFSNNSLFFKGCVRISRQ